MILAHSGILLCHSRPTLQDTHNSKIITFGLPENVSLNHAVSSAIMLNAPGVKNGKDVAKPYNPISPSDQVGSFDLLIKVCLIEFN